MESINLDSPRYVKRALLWGLFGVLILVVATLHQVIRDQQMMRSRIAVAPTVAERLASRLASSTIEGKAFIVYDIRDQQVLSGNNIEQQLPLASLTKVMTAIVAKENLPDFTVITVPDEIPKVDKRVIQPGHQWTLKELLTYTLVTSSNEGARSVASVVGALGQESSGSAVHPKEWFIKKMNNTAERLGLSQTYFINESGLDLSEPGFISGAYGSAKDLATLFAFTLQTHPDLFEATVKDRVLVHSQQKSYTADNTNKALGELPELIGSKTGLTDLSGGNLAVALDIGINHPIIIAVLGSSEEGRFTDVVTLAQATIEAMGSYR